MNGEKEQRMGAPNATRPEPMADDGKGEVDRRVLMAIRSGDLRSATALCARHYGASLGRLCMAMVSSQAEADDLVQETLLAAHDGFPAFRGEGTVAAWLFGIARRKCARHVERCGRHEARLRLVHDADRQPPTDELCARRERAERARAALNEVRPSEREALLLRYVAELSYGEVGEACGVDEPAARKRVSRALANLRSILVNKE
jgi:RNA polymerase sigma-70 factor (ECF subfamily)